MKKQFILFFATILAINSLNAQVVSYNGLGRTIIQDDNFKGKLIEDDSLSPSSGTGGYILFDLGVNIHPSKVLKASAILRSRMEFGGFFGDGASLEFRQFHISGIVGKDNKGLKYELGDLDLKLSPFTLYNNEETYAEYESDIFKQRREIIEYENFNIGNNWRLQGINLSGNLIFDKVLERADLQLFGTRQRNSISFEEPDRFLFGTNLKITQSKNILLNINATHFTDAPSTINTPSNKYENTVVTGNLVLNKVKKGKGVKVSIESGLSNFSYENVEEDRANNLNDIFSHAEVEGKLESINLALTLGYRYVGFDFLSVGAQTRRTLDYGVPTIFGSVRGATAFRSPVIFDRYSEQGIYNQELSPTLALYNPRYNLVSPYGVATPNRTGFSVGIADIKKSEWISYGVTFNLLTEIVGEGTEAKRNFTELKGGTNLQVNELINRDKSAIVSFGARHETSNREDDLVNFSVLSLDAGLDLEVLKNLYLQVGYKHVLSSGNEFLGVRDEFNELVSYTPFNTQEGNSNIREQILSTGLKYNFGKYSVFTFNAHFVDLNNRDISEDNYQIHEYFFGYTLKF